MSSIIKDIERSLCNDDEKDCQCKTDCELGTSGKPWCETIGPCKRQKVWKGMHWKYCNEEIKTCVDKLGNFQSSMNEFSKKNNIYASQTYKLLYACESCIEKEEKGDSNCAEQQPLLPETDIKCATLFIHMLSPCGQFSEEEVSGFFVKSNYQGYGWGDWRDECSKKFSNCEPLYPGYVGTAKTLDHHEKLCAQEQCVKSGLGEQFCHNYINKHH